MEPYEKYISKQDIESIHEHTLKVLSDVGVKFEHEEVLELFKKNGAKVDGNIVYISGKLLNEALSSVPKEFVIYSSKGELKIGNNSFVKIPVGSAAFFKDGDKIRPINNDDIIKLAKIADTSDLVDSLITHHNFYDEEFTDEENELGHLAILLKYGNKPASFGFAVGRPPKEKIQESYVKGIRLINDFEGVYDKVTSCHGFNPLTPLCYDFAPLERIIGVCKEKQAICFPTCAMPVLTAPNSLVSLLTVANAEILAGIVFTQLLSPGTPVIYANVSGSSDLRSVQLCMGNPETSLISYATAGIADYYGIPFRTGGAFNDAKDLDYQAGMETMLSVNTTCTIKPDMFFHALGTMGTYNVMSLEKFLLDEEAYFYMERINKGVDVTEEKFCMDLIREVGPRGNYLRGRTPKMFREDFYMTKCLNKSDANDWQHRGAKPLQDSVHEKVEKRLDSFKPASITKEQEELLNKYIPKKYRDSI